MTARTFLVLPISLSVALLWGADSGHTLSAFPGVTPKLDGLLSPGEWGDATQFYGVTGWTSKRLPVTSQADLSIHGFVKHDDTQLYFAFDVADNAVRDADGIRLFLESAEGSSWNAFCSPSKPLATNKPWIASGALRCIARVNSTGTGYVLEWAIRFRPCLEIAPGKYYSSTEPSRAIRFNLTVIDEDRAPAAGKSVPILHEEWFAGGKDTQAPSNWGTLWLLGGRSGASTSVPPR